MSQVQLALWCMLSITLTFSYLQPGYPGKLYAVIAHSTYFGGLHGNLWYHEKQFLFISGILRWHCGQYQHVPQRRINRRFQASKPKLCFLRLRCGTSLPQSPCIHTGGGEARAQSCPAAHMPPAFWDSCFFRCQLCIMEGGCIHLFLGLLCQILSHETLRLSPGFFPLAFCPCLYFKNVLLHERCILLALDYKQVVFMTSIDMHVCGLHILTKRMRANRSQNDICRRSKVGKILVNLKSCNA